MVSNYFTFGELWADWKQEQQFFMSAFIDHRLCVYITIVTPTHK